MSKKENKKDFFDESLLEENDLFDEDYDEMDYDEESRQKMMEEYEKYMGEVQRGKIVKGKIEQIDHEHGDVVVNIGAKSEGIIPTKEFEDASGDLNIQVGDEVDVYIEIAEDKEGKVIISKKKADKLLAWDKVVEAFSNNMVVEGQVVKLVKGGLTVNVFGLDGFLPGSQVDINKVTNFDDYVGNSLRLKVIKINPKNKNVIFSRRQLLEEERDNLRSKLLEDMQEGNVLEGIVKNITSYGVFIDLGGLDGLLHIKDISWGRINHPSEKFAIGDKIKVKVIKYDADKERVSLGIKQMKENPWLKVEEKYPIGTVVKGKIVSMEPYGVFVELEEGIEGLIHISDMSWTKKIKHPSEIVDIGDTVKAKVLKIDVDNEQLSLGIKQIEPNPWEKFAQTHKPGDKITGKVMKFEPYGSFVEVNEGIVGLIHITDMSWTKIIRHPSELMKKNETIEARIIEIDPDNRKLALGLKQISEDPWLTLQAKHPVGSVVDGKVVKIIESGAFAEIENGIEGFIHISQISDKRIDKVEDELSVGDTKTMRIFKIDFEARKLELSIKSHLEEIEKKELEKFVKTSSKPGDLKLGEII
ncbi:30S ribosomal protein S1, partial [Candidatus Dependentiae bacterium]|nr:30S ribosomal protein S1 [Candidatus Dependentiae bacterium]